jgi:hypothetical protein
MPRLPIKITLLTLPAIADLLFPALFLDGEASAGRIRTNVLSMFYKPTRLRRKEGVNAGPQLEKQT